LLHRLSTKRDERLEKILDEVLEKCKEAGLVVPKLEIWKIRWFFVRLDFNGIAVCPKYGIYIDDEFEEYCDDDLRILIAHEVGHCIDFFTHRCGHPLSFRLIGLNDEEFAEVIAAYLYSKEMLFEAEDRGKIGKYDLEIIRNIDFTVKYNMAKSVE
jgi:hypothetical protein